jgi:hypothetical protein
MLTFRLAAIVAACALVVGCTAAQVATTQTVLGAVPAELAAACATAQKASGIAQATVKGGAASTVSNITAYIDAGCATGGAIAQLAADPTSTDWVKGLTAGLAVVASAGTPPAKS